MSQRPPLRWIAYSVIEVFKKSSYSTFPQASEVAQSNFLWTMALLTGQTPSSIPAKIIVVPLCMIK